MRFLVDRCAGVTLAKWLRDEGHDVEDASGWSDDPGDAAILQRATEEDRILVTIDTDFGLLIFVNERPIEVSCGCPIAQQSSASRSSPICSTGIRRTSMPAR
jgi:predicted nuclease of predicted toxin-antitoxin system